MIISLLQIFASTLYYVIIIVVFAISQLLSTFWFGDISEAAIKLEKIAIKKT